MNRISKLLNLLADPKSFHALISLRYNGYLLQRGWFTAYKTGTPVGGKNEPLPWMTYPFISFIEQRLTREMDIFEYGSGYSTLYFAPKVRTIISVEHDIAWLEKMKADIPGNSTINYIELDVNGAYAQSSVNSGKQFDIIIVDGRDRVNCMKQSVEALNRRGVLILDDAQREEYRPGINYLGEKNFKRISFTGIAPGNLDEKNTDVFYRSDNCLNI